MPRAIERRAARVQREARGAARRAMLAADAFINEHGARRWCQFVAAARRARARA
jgi:hypothetical protein